MADATSVQLRGDIQRLDRRIDKLTPSGGGGGPHTHPESDVSNLAADLAAKAASAHAHVEGDVTSLTADLAALGGRVPLSRIVAADLTLAADQSFAPVDWLEVASGVVLDLAAGSVVEVLS